MYKRIANALDHAALDELKIEMIDRFGLLPAPLRNLFRTTAVKLVAGTLGIDRVDIGPVGGRLEFGTETEGRPLHGRLDRAAGTQHLPVPGMPTDGRATGSSSGAPCRIRTRAFSSSRNCSSGWGRPRPRWLGSRGERDPVGDPGTRRRPRRWERCTAEPPIPEDRLRYRWYQVELLIFKNPPPESGALAEEGIAARPRLLETVRYPRSAFPLSGEPGRTTAYPFGPEPPVDDGMPLVISNLVPPAWFAGRLRH